MPTPATAPPSVMVFSCGTTAGITPCSRQASRQRLVRDHAFGIDPTRRRSPLSTSLKCARRASRRGRAERSRKRFDVSFSIGRPARSLARALSCAARASFFLLCRLLLRALSVEEAPTSWDSLVSVTSPFENTTWKRCVRPCGERNISAQPYRYARQTRRKRSSNSSDRGRGSCPSCGRSARPRRPA